MCKLARQLAGMASAVDESAQRLRWRRRFRTGDARYYKG